MENEEVTVLRNKGFGEYGKQKTGKHAPAAAVQATAAASTRTLTASLAIAVSMLLAGCSVESGPAYEGPELPYAIGTIYMGTGEEGSTARKAGSGVAAVLNNTVPGIHVAQKTSKGSMVNAVNVSEGNLELALVAADVAYDAANGENSFEGEKIENLRVLAACYQEVSGWAAKKDSGLTNVSELKGKVISSGAKASSTDTASELVFTVMGIDETNTEIYFDSISSSVNHIKEGTADASHAFSAVPNSAHESLANETETVFLSYTEEEIAAILEEEPRYFAAEIPAGTYQGQEEAVPTFGVKVLLCTSEEMDEDLAYEIARAMDLNGPVHTADKPFMAAIQDKEFLCNEVPIPLHEGAKKYYMEQGYLKE